ncbi:MAG: hypothetical protein V1926_00940 [Candidatus Peregrinibacteria bacterium]
MHFIEHCLQELLRDVDTIGEHVETIRQAVQLQELSAALQECNDCLHSITLCRNELVAFVNKNNFTLDMPQTRQWARTELQQLMSHIRQLQAETRGLRTRLQPQGNGDPVPANTTLLTLMKTEAEHNLRLMHTAAETDQGNKRVQAIVRGAMKFATPRHERVNAIGEVLHEILERIAVDFSTSSDTFDVEEDISPDAAIDGTSSAVEDARSDFEQMDAEIHQFLVDHLEEIRDLLPREPTQSARKDKRERERQERSLKKRVLRGMELLVMAFVAFQERKAPADPERFFYGLQELRDAIQQIGGLYSKEFETHIVIPSERDGREVPQEIPQEDVTH